MILGLKFPNLSALLAADLSLDVSHINPKHPTSLPSCSDLKGLVRIN